MTYSETEEVQKYIDSQDWYQTIELSTGLKTPGKFDTRKRLPALAKIDFANSTVLDIGCNSGQYCLFARHAGASFVRGVDTSKKRIEQAKKLAEIEGLDISFECMEFEELEDHQFDIVLCFAVLTEIVDFTRALKKILNLTGGTAYIELALAFRGQLEVDGEASVDTGKLCFKRSGPYHLGVIKRRKDGTLIPVPTLDLLRNLVGADFSVDVVDGGYRYEMVKVERK